MFGRARMAAAGAIALIAAAIGTTQARSEVFEACVSVDGLLAIEGEQLFEEDLATRERRPQPYKIRRRTLLREVAGYCESDQAPGQRFPFWRRATAIAVTLDGRVGEVDLLCESLGDGLPAGLDCDRERITTSRGAHVD